MREPPPAKTLDAVAVRLLASVLGCLLATACGGHKSRPECNRSEQIVVRLAPEPQLNHDREGYSRSVVLRLYQLKAYEGFEQASFEDVWSTAAAPADGAGGGPEELTAIPGKQETHVLSRNPKATHLGIAANFREHGDTDWKSVVALRPPEDPCATEPPPTAADLTIQLANYSLSVR